MSTSIESIDGVAYRIDKVGRTWVASTWCGCILGPHWHEVDKAPRRGLLVEQLRTGAVA